jgi:hypothetical protein
VTTTTTPTEPSYKDAKAQAKAAKAYAMAQRPFYKKKRFIFPAAIATVAIISFAMQGGGSDNGTAVKDSGSTSSNSTSDAGSQSSPYKVGQTIELEGTQYTVTGASTQGKIGGAFGEKADGTFVVVDLTIENKKDETKTFMDEAATFVASDGTQYEGSDAAIYLENSLWLQDMQPDLPIDGQLVFDVPPSKVAGGILMVEDLFGGGEANIALGLK